MIKRLTGFAAAVASITMLVPAIASAHVIVTPSTAGVGAELVFNVSSPNEQQTPIVKVTLNIPKGVADVVPTAEDGWTIATVGNGSTSDPEITAITWSGGQIPVGQREDFGFSAQVPGSTTTLDWKAYQTYADGTVVHWDQTPSGKSDDSVGNAGPFSVTQVVDDLTPAPKNTSSGNTTLPLLLSIVALVFSVIALQRKKS